MCSHLFSPLLESFELFSHTCTQLISALVSSSHLISALLSTLSNHRTLSLAQNLLQKRISAPKQATSTLPIGKIWHREAFPHSEVLHREACTRRSFYAELGKFWFTESFCTKQALVHSKLFPNLLHREAFTKRSFYAQQALTQKSSHAKKHLHTESFYAEAFTHRSTYVVHSFYTHSKPLHTASLCAEKLLHTETFTHRSIYTQQTFTRRSFCTQQAFAQRSPFTEKHLHGEAFDAQRLLRLYSFYTWQALTQRSS